MALARPRYTLMKEHIVVILALLVAGATQAQTSIRTKASSVSRALAVYSLFAHKELVIEPSATNQLKTIKIDFTATKSLTEAEAANVIESELHKQADIVITPLDDKRSSVKLVKK